jgi:hypothetical protein
LFLEPLLAALRVLLSVALDLCLVEALLPRAWLEGLAVELARATNAHDVSELRLRDVERIPREAEPVLELLNVAR